MIPNKEIILTKADKLILQAMRTVVHGLGVYLGEGCEINRELPSRIWP